MQSTGLEERMSAAGSDSNVAFQSAEAALRDAEQYIKSTADVNNPFNPLKSNGGPFGKVATPSCTNGLCQRPSTTTTPSPWVSFSESDWTTSGLSYGSKTAASAIDGVSAQPRYVIELLAVTDAGDGVRCYGTFRLTARAWGANDTTVAQLQTIFRLKAISCAI